MTSPLTIELIEEGIRLAMRPQPRPITLMPADLYELVKKYGWERGTLLWIERRDAAR